MRLVVNHPNGISKYISTFYKFSLKFVLLLYLLLTNWVLVCFLVVLLSLLAPAESACIRRLGLLLFSPCLSSSSLPDCFSFAFALIKKKAGDRKRGSTSDQIFVQVVLLCIAYVLRTIIVARRNTLSEMSWECISNSSLPQFSIIVL